MIHMENVYFLQKLVQIFPRDFLINVPMKYIEVYEVN